MNYEIIHKRQDGSKVKIYISCWLDRVTGMNYNVQVERCEKNKRTFKDVHNSDNYTWRALDYPNRMKHIYETQLLYVSEDEIYQAKIALWNLLKPTKPH